MARFALDRLAATGRPFFLLLEDEGIDSAAHDGDLAALSETLLRFDAAVAAAVEFAVRDGRTLVLVTADHATGGLAIVPEPEAGKLAVAWTGDVHTGEPVPLFAYGPGAAQFAGLRDIDEIGRAIAASFGLAADERPSR
jgi:alkaline phosphatase